MIFKDKAGNAVQAGDAVWFDPVSGVTELLSIVPPSRDRQGKDQPGVMSLRIDIPFVHEKGHGDQDDFAFGFILVTRNPRKDASVEAQVAGILSGKVAPAATLTMPKRDKAKA